MRLASGPESEVRRNADEDRLSSLLETQSQDPTSSGT